MNQAKSNTSTKMNQHIPFEITVISADILKSTTTTNFFTKLRTYTVATLISGGGSIARQRTPIDEHSGAKPNWRFPMKFQVEESMLQSNQSMIVLQLRRKTALGSKNIGSLYIPMKELLDNAGGHRSPIRVSYQVSSPSGKVRGVLYLSYVFGRGETVANGVVDSDPLATLYPIPSAPYVNQCVAVDSGFSVNPNRSSSLYLPLEDGCFRSNSVPSAPYIGYA